MNWVEIGPHRALEDCFERHVCIDLDCKMLNMMCNEFYTQLPLNNRSSDSLTSSPPARNLVLVGLAGLRLRQLMRCGFSPTSLHVVQVALPVEACALCLGHQRFSIRCSSNCCSPEVDAGAKVRPPGSALA